MERIWVMILFLQISLAMLIPEETEMLEGYTFPETLADDDYFEARSLSKGPLFNSVRNKRSHDIKESDGLISHFRPNSVNGYSRKMSIDESQITPTNPVAFRKLKKWLKKKFPNDDSDESTDNSNLPFGSIILPPTQGRRRRSIENEKKIKITSSKDEIKSNINSENSPSPSAAALVSGKFARSPFEYSKIQHEEDSMAMDTSSLSINEGMKSRTPRVNFVTAQQKKSLDRDDTKTSATKSDFYKSPPLLHNSKESTPTSSSERYPERSTNRPSSYPDRDMNNNHYDDRYFEDMYPPPPPHSQPDMPYDPMFDYNLPYDLYMRRQYAYPGSRYDIPDYRDFYPPMYGNDIDSRYYMRTDSMQPSLPASSVVPRKRTIYYAYLPEVVRSPPSVDFRYRSYDRYDSRYEPAPYYPEYYNRYEANSMVSNAYHRPDKPFKHEYRTTKPMKIYNDDMVRNNSSFKEKRFDHERFYNDNKLPMQTYSHHRPSEYDSYY
ncbi:uncharacterized protein LOC116342578 [Contarinia nasturtii]|uniref:uncharacterized protein LOC116342578 n=1 Tax=Contarinia nasturtii TaxID=265458 RepID=UPI0012D49640|nr:uncharacterized protein LOC116342578 [Contarinia nasturtii]